MANWVLCIELVAKAPRKTSICILGLKAEAIHVEHFMQGSSSGGNEGIVDQS